jgi:hypothetical protein
MAAPGEPELEFSEIPQQDRPDDMQFLLEVVEEVIWFQILF